MLGCVIKNGYDYVIIVCNGLDNEVIPRAILCDPIMIMIIILIIIMIIILIIMMTIMMIVMTST